MTALRDRIKADAAQAEKDRQARKRAETAKERKALEEERKSAAEFAAEKLEASEGELELELVDGAHGSTKWRFTLDGLRFEVTKAGQRNLYLVVHEGTDKERVHIIRRLGDLDGHLADA